MTSLGLLAYPEIAGDFARRLGAELPAYLPDPPYGEWEICVVAESDIPGGDDLTEIIDAALERKEREGWDVLVWLTDLPLGADRSIVVADISVSDNVALISMPALGGLRLHTRTRRAISRLVEELLRDDTAQGQDLALGGRRAPLRRVYTDDDIVDVRFVASPLRGRVRLLLGMVREHRPWRLVPGMPKALATTVAATAFGILTNTIWSLADALGVLRLAIACIASIAAMVVWLIVAHDLWERSAHRDDGRADRVRLYNAATVLTLTAGVGVMYLVMFVVTLAVSVFIIDGSVLKATLGHDPNAGTWLAIAWMTTSVALVAGALGSSLQDDRLVREAAFGKRERERRRALGLPDRGTDHEAEETTTSA